MVDCVQAGIVAARQGQHQEARELFQQALRENLQNEQAWLWMSMVVDSAAERQICLERALSINPDNQGARAELEKIAVTPTRNELPLKPLSGDDSPRNGSRAASPFDAPVSVAGAGRSSIQPLPVLSTDQPLRTMSTDFVSTSSLPPQLLPEEDVPPWVTTSRAVSADLPVEEASVVSLALTGCLSITAVSGLLALGVVWMLGW